MCAPHSPEPLIATAPRWAVVGESAETSRWRPLHTARALVGEDDVAGWVLRSKEPSLLALRQARDAAPQCVRLSIGDVLGGLHILSPMRAYSAHTQVPIDISSAPRPSGRGTAASTSVPLERACLQVRLQHGSPEIAQCL